MLLRAKLFLNGTTQLSAAIIDIEFSLLLQALIFFSYYVFSVSLKLITFNAYIRLGYYRDFSVAFCRQNLKSLVLVVILSLATVF